MDHRQVGKLWEENAAAWTELCQRGYNILRDAVNTPAFLDLLPEVEGLCGLDIGCGDGHESRLIAEQGAKIVGIDLAPTFVRFAQACDAENPQGGAYLVASAVEMPFPDAAFDFAVGMMSFMDIPEQEILLREAHRVLRPRGFLLFSILHPCFMLNLQSNWVRDEAGRRIALEVGDYWNRPPGQIEQWTFGAAPQDVQDSFPKFRIPRFDRTLEEWLNMVIEAGFVLEQVREPRPTEDQIREDPRLYDSAIIPWFIHFRCRKP